MKKLLAAAAVRHGTRILHTGRYIYARLECMLDGLSCLICTFSYRVYSLIIIIDLANC